ncbi:MAG: hypothetical protein ACTHJ2_03970 [Candidatus Nitrosocosmicus sp.]
MDKKCFILIGIFVTISVVISPILQVSYAHQRVLYTINGKDYLFVIGSLNEPAFINDKTGVDFSAYWPNATDPTNTKANGTQPITGLEKMLKVEIIAGNKTMKSDLEPAFGKLGAYTSDTFYPTIPTTYTYRIFGDINGTSFDAKYPCNPAGGEAAKSDNSTVQISKNVERKASLGGFGCFEKRVGFPEPILSQHDLIQELNKTKS